MGRVLLHFTAVLACGFTNSSIVFGQENPFHYRQGSARGENSRGSSPLQIWSVITITRSMYAYEPLTKRATSLSGNGGFKAQILENSGRSLEYCRNGLSIKRSWERSHNERRLVNSDPLCEGDDFLFQTQVGDAVGSCYCANERSLTQHETESIRLADKDSSNRSPAVVKRSEASTAQAVKKPFVASDKKLDLPPRPAAAAYALPPSELPEEPSTAGEHSPASTPLPHSSSEALAPPKSEARPEWLVGGGFLKKIRENIGKKTKGRNLIPLAMSAKYKSNNFGLCGTRHYNPDTSGGVLVDNFINPTTACVFTKFLQDWKKTECSDPRSGCTVNWGDISHRDRELFNTHKSHTSGYCIDIRPLRKGGFEDKPLTYTSKAYDGPKTKQLIKKLKAAGASVVLFNDPKSGGRYFEGHHNHIHVCFDDSAANRERCDNFKPDLQVCPEL